jgi:hypothetical protein
MSLIVFQIVIADLVPLIVAEAADGLAELSLRQDKGSSMSSHSSWKAAALKLCSEALEIRYKRTIGWSKLSLSSYRYSLHFACFL